MRNFTFIFVLVLSLQLEAQNIVQNGGFEEINFCPNSAGQVWIAEYWTSSANSPDLFNACGDHGFGAPLNELGFQSPRNGNGYAMMGTYFEDFEDTREFIQNELRYSLITNEQYYVELYVSLCDSAEIASHNVGITLTKVDTATYLPCYLDCEIYYDNDISNPLTSKTDWVKVSGTFTAHGGERYLHLGNLRTDVNSEFEFVGGGGVGPDHVWNFAAYYIDDVWLSHIDSAHYVGISPLSALGGEIEVFPNPSTGTVTFNCNLNGGDAAELRVFDAVGRGVYSETLGYAQGNKPVRLEGLSEGIYHCLLVVNGKASLSEKLVILRE